MHSDNFSLRNLTRAFLAGAWSQNALLQRGCEACTQTRTSLRPLIQHLISIFPDPQLPPTEDTLYHHLARRWGARQLGIRRLFWLEPSMQPRPGLPNLDALPALTTTTALASWLGLTAQQLDWFVACPGWTRRAPSGPLCHYIHRWLQRPGGRQRLLEIPRPRLRALQRQILHGLLDHLPPHEAVHSYRHGRSILSYVAPHAGRAIVLRFDLRDFFPSIPAGRVHALFTSLGYPRAVARTLTRLCTTVVPLSLPGEGEDNGVDWKLYRSPHLPQGAPTSPALANLCGFRLDSRLAGLARGIGARYTRYADDLAFSGPAQLATQTRRLHVLVARIALEEGFEINTRKTRCMRQGVRQHLAGVVLNVKPNVSRADYDRLKAILCNCLRHGPATQNRAGVPDFQAHLLGRIAHLAGINPARGARLRELFARIVW